MTLTLIDKFNRIYIVNFFTEGAIRLEVHRKKVYCPNL